MRPAARLLSLLALLGAALPLASQQLTRDHHLALAPESELDRELRHQLVAERRQGPAILVRRGATAAAPENSLMALAVAMDWGADGVEVDLRRTRDGVIVLFNDLTLDRLTHGIGEVPQVTAATLLALRPRETCGRPASGPAPSLVQLLDLARQRAMLLHLDVQEPGLEEEIARWLDAADCWDHVVAVNRTHAPGLLQHPNFRPLTYKAPALHPGRADLDHDTVRSVLELPGIMILVDDPRVAASVLKRPAYRPVPFLRTFRLVTRRPPAPPTEADAGFNPAACVAALPARVNPDSALALVRFLELPFDEADDLLPDPALQTRRATRIVERAWAADRLGLLGRRHRDVFEALERVLRQPTPHPDPRYHALDAALAARALGLLGSTASAPLLIDRFETRTTADPGAEMRFQTHLLAALADLRCKPARRFLQSYVTLDEVAASRLGRPLFAEATRALLRQDLAPRELRALLASENPAVRGTAIIECHDQPTPSRRAALQSEAPWVLALPAARTVPPPPTPPAPKVRAGVDAPLKGAP